MDSCIRTILTYLEAKGVLDDTIVVLNSDHGETLYEHECWFDHHGLYDSNLHVPLIIRYPKRVPVGLRVSGYNQHKDLVPTLLELAEIECDITFDGESLMDMLRGEAVSHESEVYITECTWMRKNGWRTPQWKLIRALEPDFHFKPPVELYDLVEDPQELRNVADDNPEVVEVLTRRMKQWIEARERESGLANPMYNQGDWHGYEGVGAFKSSPTGLRYPAHRSLFRGQASAGEVSQLARDKIKSGKWTLDAERGHSRNRRHRQQTRPSV